MLVRVPTSTIAGIDAVPVEVETDISKRLPSYTIVGLPGGAVLESADRVRAAIRFFSATPRGAEKRCSWSE